MDLWSAWADRLAGVPVRLLRGEAEARAELSKGPAAWLLAPSRPPRSGPLTVCFDWDSTAASGAGDAFISQFGREAFAEREWALRKEPADPGPLFPAFKALSERKEVRVEVLTARTGTEAARVMATLEAWGIRPAALHFAGDRAKGPIAAATEADILFDDILRHALSAQANGVCGGWVPFGDAQE